MTDIFQNEGWSEILEKFASRRGSLIVIGGVDTGKSTFCRWVFGRLQHRGAKTAYIDLDVGQSHISPPGCMGIAVYDPKHKEPRERIEGIYLTGSISPAGHEIKGLQGLKHLYSKARKLGTTHQVINTTGWVEGRDAVHYKQAKIDLVNPRFIVAIQKEKELNPIINPYRKMKQPETIIQKVSEHSVERNTAERKNARIERTKKYFENSRLLAVKPEKTGISGTALPLKPESVRDRMIALINEFNRTLDVGIVKSFNKKTRIIEILSPYRGDIRSIARIHFEDYIPEAI